jgi:hypothetical protein
VKARRALGTREPRPWKPSCPRKLEGHLPNPNTDVGSENEPEPSGDLDLLDPEPNFRRHPNAWRLWAARAERRRAEKASGPAAAATASSSERGNRPSAPTKPPLPKTFTGADGDVEWFIRQLADYFGLARVTDDLDKIRTAGMLCDGKAGGWYETYRLKIDRNMAMRVLGKWVEDPKFQTWEHFEARSDLGALTIVEMKLKQKALEYTNPSTKQSVVS